MVRKQAAKRRMRVYEENIDVKGETVGKVIEARRASWCRTLERTKLCSEVTKGGDSIKTCLKFTEKRNQKERY